MINDLGRQQVANWPKGYRLKPGPAPENGQSQSVDGFSPSSFPPPSPYDRPLTTGIKPSSSLLRKLGQAFGLVAAPVAVPGPAGLAVGLTLASLKELSQKTTLEDKDVLVAALDKATSQMNQSSGIVEMPKGVPTMVIPDVHAQRDYLIRALEHKVDGEKVFDLLKQGKLNLLVLGDGMHSEARGEQRWLAAENHYLAGIKNSPAMHDEIVESFGTMKMVMDLKAEMGDHLVYLRGNRDDIVGGFRKFCGQVGESELMAQWVSNRYGQDFVQKWAAFEQSMPLVAKGTGFVASHAAPGAPLTREQIESRESKAFQVLSWTDNTAWEEAGPKRPIFEANKDAVGAGQLDRWLVGHRKVQGANFRGQFDNSLIQINPTHAEGFVVAMVGADGKFDPQADTFKV